ncbi:PPA1309 family protein [Nocardioides sp.]|uniref:PPA1309 family protein n=1 Tax=Nocardioides sp. TaxID=35761 RepID=UPI00263196A2|nr:PPA1309 family protein [Nocardioides sp.]
MSESTFAPDAALSDVVMELEAHAAQSGWDRPATLYALVDTAAFAAAQPSLASLLGLEPGQIEPGSLTPIEQDHFDEPLEQVLPTIAFDDNVVGIAVVVERPAEAGVPTAEGGEQEHMRVIAGVTRAGSAYCAARSRVHDRPEAVVTGDDLVPALVDLLRAVLEEDQ